eukprot:8170382-Prorocentrum_lima.AAC.1
MHLRTPLVAEVNKDSMQLGDLGAVRVANHVACRLGHMGRAGGPNLGNGGSLEPGDHVAQQE